MTTSAPIAIVTGASSGIGQATAIELARRGTRVIATYHANPDGIAQTIERIEAAGGEAAALRLDIGDSATFAAFADAVRDVLRERWDREHFDHLVNNAGFGANAPFAETTEAVFDELMRALLKGPYFLTQRLLPLIADGGAIVNITSGTALPHVTAVDFSAYGAAKGGLATVSRYLAKELAPRGIRVNAIAPGSTRTRLGGDAFTLYPEVIPPLIERTALGRLGEPEDIARVIAVLLSEDGAWVTAQHIEVSGGFDL